MRGIVRLKQGSEITIEITSMAGALGVGRHEGMAIMCEGALLGERVRALVLRVHKSYANARMLEVLTSSKDRVKPPCEYADMCGGCAFQHLDYGAQLEYKRTRIADALERIGGVGGVAVEPVVGMDMPHRYRNKGVFFAHGAENPQIGLHKRGTRDIVDISDCLLQHENCAEIITALRAGIVAHGAPFEKMMIRTSAEGKSVVALGVKRRLPAHAKLAKDISRLSCVGGIALCGVGERGNAFLNPEVVYGDIDVQEVLCGFEYRIPVQSFFQVNTAQAQALYEIAVGMATAGIIEGADSRALDLYCGMGTLTMALAREFGHVLGVEVQAASVAEAREAARRNDVSNVEFIAGDAEKVLPSIGGTFNAVVLDPPRAGCTPKVLEAVAALRAPRLVYVSCDPATLARDIKLLRAFGYELRRVKGVDMFCFTEHVECVAQMKYSKEV